MEELTVRVVLFLQIKFSLDLQLRLFLKVVKLKSNQFKNLNDKEGGGCLIHSIIASDRPKQDFMAETEISATILVSAETETLKKLKLMILCIFESMRTFQIINEICYKCLTRFFYNNNSQTIIINNLTIELNPIHNPIFFSIFTLV